MRHHITHGPRRLLLKPWRTICRCGMGVWPCPAVRMQREQEAMRPPGRPSWAGPTKRLPRLMGGPTGPRPERADRDLMTPGQRARSARAFRR